MAQGAPSVRERPLSPHLQVWRWHVTMAASILHRVTGVALYAGVLILAAWALALASGAESYGEFMGVLGSIPGKIVLLGLTVSLFFHLANGVRHLFWDGGKGFAPRTADATAWVALAFALVASIAIWIWAAMTGAL
ncbi:MAG: succinate dehydrogenase, cytochrome b556 subunit [Caulobacteraceae bacterium]